jgi:pilus assembly protein Flp/PilA
LSALLSTLLQHSSADKRNLEREVQDLRRIRAFPGAGKNRTEENSVEDLFQASLTRLHRDEAGQGLVEYALILVLVALAAVVAMQTLANDINKAFFGVGTVLSSYVP